MNTTELLKKLVLSDKELKKLHTDLVDIDKVLSGKGGYFYPILQYVRTNLYSVELMVRERGLV